MVYLLYDLLLIIWGLALLPVFLYRAVRQGKRMPGLSQRWGRLPEALRAAGREVIWFHACSVGETLSLEPLVRALRQLRPEARMVFSTITPTGQEIARKNFGAANVFYFPLDFSFVIRRVLDWIKPDLIVTIDTEIWPNLLRQAHRRGIAIVMVNGRISSRSFPRYRLARPLLRRVLASYAALMMQSAGDAERIAALGAPARLISTPGNLKFDRDLFPADAPAAAAVASTECERERDLAENFLVAGAGPLLVAGSTHAGEERILLAVLRQLRHKPALACTRLLLAPRHPERFAEAADEARRAGFAVWRRTASRDRGATTDGNVAATAPVLLLDTVGELAKIYRFADVVFVGGTLAPHGGHSILEPAAFAKAIVIGPSMDNFRAIRDEFVARRAVRQIAAANNRHAAQEAELLLVFAELLRDSAARAALGQRARAILDDNRGAAQRIAARLIAILEAS